MSKRFFDTEMVLNDWFCRMRSKEKLLWLFLISRCDMAGVIKPNWALASSLIGQKVTAGDIGAMAGNILEFKPGWYFIPKFAEFQYGELHPEKSRVHAAVIRVLQSHGIPYPYSMDTLSVGCAKGMDTLKDKDKNKDKEKDKEIRGESRGGNAQNDWTLEDCLKAAVSIAMRREDVEAFYANYASVGWIDAAGRKITNLPAALAKWKSRESSHGKRFSEKDGKPTVYELKTRIETAEQEYSTIRARHQNDGRYTPEEKSRMETLRKNIKGWKDQLTGVTA